MRLNRGGSHSRDRSRSRYVAPSIRTVEPLDGSMKAVLGVCLVLGIAFGMIGIRSLNGTRAFVATAERADGEVVSVLSGFGISNTVPVVEFEAADGLTYRFAGRLKGMAFHELGDRVAVLYDRADPARSSMDFWPELWLSTTVFCLLGAAFAVVTALVALVMIRR